MAATVRNADSPAKAGRVRAFYALWPDEQARARIARLACDVARQAGGRAIVDRNLHVTLAFIGEVAPARLDALGAAGACAVDGIAAIDVSLDRLGGAHGGELVWLASASVPSGLAELHANLVAALRVGGFPLEQRAFRPHITLARRCTGQVERAPFTPIEWRVTRVTLMASTPGAGGSEYRELDAWPLLA